MDWGPRRADTGGFCLSYCATALEGGLNESLSRSPTLPVWSSFGQRILHEFVVCNETQVSISIVSCQRASEMTPNCRSFQMKTRKKKVLAQYGGTQGMESW